MSLLLLYKSGYTVGRYISLERIVEDTKEGYYDALHASSQGWHEGEHNLNPWLEYFLGVMLTTAYREFENRVGLVETAKGVILDSRQLQDEPKIGVDAIERITNKLKKNQFLTDLKHREAVLSLIYFMTKPSLGSESEWYKGEPMKARQTLLFFSASESK